MNCVKRTKNLWNDLHQYSAFIISINSAFLSLLYNGGSYMLKGLLYKLTDTVGFSRCQYIIIRFISLQHDPHSLYVITSMAPITLGINVSKGESLFETQADTRYSASNLTSDE